MTQPVTAGNSDSDKILERLHALERRMETMEAQFISGRGSESGRHSSATGEAMESNNEMMEVDEGAIESKIGEYGLAWLGSLVLLFGIIFLMTFVGSQGYPVLASGLGYTSAAGVFILAYFLRRSFPHMDFMLNISGHLLIYYITLRLYFFSHHPLIPWKEADLVLLIVAIGVQVYLAIRRSSELLTGIAIVLLIITALISDSLHSTMLLITTTAAAALYLFYRYNWWRLMVVSLILVYLSQIIWLMNDPFLGHPFELLPSHPYNPVYLFACGFIFSMSTLIRRNPEFAEKGMNTLVLLNGLWFAMTIIPVIAIYYPVNYVGMFGAISGFCLLLSVLLHRRIRYPFIPAFFACFGFMALSVSVYGYAKLPDAYFFLALQSFLVVSMALWFRSRIIVVMNTGLYLGILLIYLLSFHPVGRISFCFAFVAFATARILNWKKERLTLKTDMMRNMYLVALFFTILYAFYHAVPGWYITLSWTAVAAGYFLLSFLLRNIKYRWMAIATLLVTVVYLFLVDLSNLSIGYRVIAFLFLAVILISASLFYTKRVKKRRILKSEENVIGEQS